MKRNNLSKIQTLQKGSLEYIWSYVLVYNKVNSEERLTKEIGSSNMKCTKFTTKYNNIF